jgi:hypothetical protein
MRFTPPLVAAGLALAATPALAAFQVLPTSGDLRVIGQALNDPLLVDSGPASGDGTYGFPTNFVLLAQRETDIELPDEDSGELEEVGEFFDYVFQDTSDGTLIFASRIVMDPEEEGEINDIFRAGYAGYAVSAGWTYLSDFDLRMFQAGRFDTGLEEVEEGEEEFDPDVVAMRSDINVEEGNAQSGLYMLKVAAESFYLLPDAITVYQAGEEGQPQFRYSFAGFAPVPEPSSYLMLLAGVGLLGLMVRRRIA